MSIIGTLGQITKASFRDSGLNQFILVQVTRWAIVCCMASYYTYQALLIIYRYAHVMISGSDLHVYMYSHFLIMSVELQVFFLLIQFVNSCKSNTLHWGLVLSQSEHKVIQMLLSSDDVHIWTLYCYHMTSHPITCLYTREGHHYIPVFSGCLPVSRSSRTVAGSSQSFHGHAPSLW